MDGSGQRRLSLHSCLVVEGSPPHDRKRGCGKRRNRRCPGHYQVYQAFLKREWKENEQRIRQLWGEETEGIERVHARYDRAIKNASPCDLFGIREFNNTPKLLFNDLRLKAEYRDLKKCFSIDAKNSIDSNGTEPKSNPRTYKTARTGLVFEGEIEFYQFDQAGFDVEQCRRYIMRNLEKFNDGIYRLGNSKSRGYGKIRVSFTEDGGEKRGKL